MGVVYQAAENARETAQQPWFGHIAVDHRRDLRFSHHRLSGQ
jgi:hypothetical protein